MCTRILYGWLLLGNVLKHVIKREKNTIKYGTQLWNKMNILKKMLKNIKNSEQNEENIKQMRKVLKPGIKQNTLKKMLKRMK